MPLGPLKLQFGYGSSDNNDSLRSQTITVPTVGSTSGFVATQTYSYDSLNRFSSATETVSGLQTWKQTFQYDVGTFGIDGSMQITLNAGRGIGFIDIDRYSPFEDLSGTFSHIFREVLGADHGGRYPAEIYNAERLKRTYDGLGRQQ